MDKLKRKLDRRILQALVCALVLIIALGAFPTDAAYAEGEVINLADQWYASSEFLNVAAVKALVAEQDFLGEPPAEKLTLAIIDTGITFDHPIFDGITVLEGRSFVSSSTTAVDDVSATKVYHGTHVAGIVAQFIRYFELEDYIQILPLKLGDKDANFTLVSSSKDDAVDAIRWAVDNGADVINMSFTSAKSSTITANTRNQLNEAVAYATSHNVLCVAAAGNEGSKKTSQFYPAECNGVIGVMAYNKSGYLWSSSNYNNNLDLVAPGEEILSSIKTGYAEKNGTSMASPMVAFFGALLMLKYDYNRDEVYKIMTDYSAEIISADGLSLRKFDMLKMLRYLPPESLVASFDGEEDASVLRLYGNVGELSVTAKYFRNQGGTMVETDSDAAVNWQLTINGKISLYSGRHITLPADLEIGIHTLVAVTESDSAVSSNTLTVHVAADTMQVVCTSVPELADKREDNQILGATKELSFKAMLKYTDLSGNDQLVEYPGAVTWHINYNNTTRTVKGNSRFTLPAQTAQGRVVVTAYIGSTSAETAYALDGFTVNVSYAVLDKSNVDFVYDDEDAITFLGNVYAFVGEEQRFMLSGYDYVSTAEYEGILWYVYSGESSAPICISAQYPRVEFTPDKKGDYKVVCYIDGAIVYTAQLTVLNTTRGAIIGLAAGGAAALVLVVGCVLYFAVIKPKRDKRPPKMAEGAPYIISGGEN